MHVYEQRGNERMSEEVDGNEGGKSKGWARDISAPALLALADNRLTFHVPAIGFAFCLYCKI